MGKTVREWIDGTATGRVAELLEMLVRITTYTNAPDELDAGAAAESVKSGIGAGVRYLDGGFQTLVDGLVDAARGLGVELHTGAPVSGVEPASSGFRLDAGGGTSAVDAIVVATGGPGAAAALLPERPAAWSPLGPPSTVACLDSACGGAPTTPVCSGSTSRST